MSTEGETKNTEVFIESAAPPKSQSDDPDSKYYLSPEERAIAERKLVRKLDSRLLPTIICIFILNYIDVGSGISHY